MSDNEPENSICSGVGGEMVRFTISIPTSVHRNLELYCIQHSTRKQQVALNALSEFLARNGMRPEKVPDIRYSYPPE